MKYFLKFSVGAVSSWLVTYISIDRLLIIKFSRLKLFSKKKFQLTVIAFVFVFNYAYYSAVPVFTNLNIYNSTNLETNLTSETKVCLSKTESFLYLMSLIHATIIPFVIMIMSTIFLIIYILKSRFKLFKTKRRSDKSKIQKDIQFGFTSISLNFLFIIFNLPLGINNALSLNLSSYALMTIRYLYLISYAINFYVLVMFNYIFRRHFLIMFKLARNNYNQSNTIN